MTERPNYLHHWKTCRQLECFSVEVCNLPSVSGTVLYETQILMYSLQQFTYNLVKSKIVNIAVG